MLVGVNSDCLNLYIFWSHGDIIQYIKIMAKEGNGLWS